ncbi:Okp1p [Lachancea thermotolerans CBS 6340]|uniref:KLTH0B03872p n=1 Tax=Lachancea thermotolerans (strain ATCC 56472 / CBS 6340 / NRRL Y-8284) TaxID=559295 RepID=C5DCK8_LACTC|nr:KLTH0B03872p [Lachancea thermotolerans CBS 6340]CAR21519.1 KLTH0B03872p [Lachancea thermotolerans CBS 6340]
MSLQKPLLDAIVESDHEGSVMVDHATDDSTSEVDESFVQLDGDEFRLDQEARRKGPVGKKLFVEEDSIAESPLRNGLLGPSLIASSPQKSDLESPSKRVQFKHHIDSASEEEPISEQPIDQWNFKDLIGDRFRERLPETDLKAWQRPSKRLLNSITDILENNIDLALEATFEKYEAECERLAIGRSVKHIRRDKERMLHKTIGKIERQLQSSKFPSRVKDRDFDIEYIYAKRTFIQNSFSQELEHTDSVEHQVLREQKALEDLKHVQAKLSNRALRQTKLLTEQLSHNLHPALSKAMVNSFGLIGDNAINKERYKKDVDELNLKLADPSAGVTHSLLHKYLPSLKNYEKTAEKLQGSLPNLN